jgi:hypothetical protein
MIKNGYLNYVFYHDLLGINYGPAATSEPQAFIL